MSDFIATIGYVRSLKISRLTVTCEGKRPGGWTCYHHSVMSIEGMDEAVTLASIEARLRCERCGTRGAAEVRPDWSELHQPMTERGAPWMIPRAGRP